MTFEAPEWLGMALPELTRDYLGLLASARAAQFSERLARCAHEGQVIDVKRNGAVDAIAGVEPLPWDGQHFGVGCARLAPLCVAPDLSATRRFSAVAEIIDAAIRWGRANGIKMLVRRMIGARAEEARLFEERGFRLADSIVTFNASAAASPADLAVRPATVADREALRAIAWEAFPHSRFLVDPGFDREKAHMVYVHWLDGLLTGNVSGEKSAADGAVLIAERKGRAAGFLAIRRDRPADALLTRALAVIELFAVATLARGHGIGGLLLLAARDWAARQEATLVEASTWTAAIAARRTYQRAGFTCCDNILTFHGWMT